jgi:hypothetical protein
MQLPNFTAEASIYQTTSHYRLTAGGDLLAHGNGNVVPQDCGWFQGIFCGVVVAATTAACSALCFGGPLPCGVCVTAALGASYGACKDCLPSWIRALLDIFESGGGGGGPSCCPPGTICSCGGHCFSGLCTGICLPPGAACPPPPPPPPIGCEVGEKCCERDEQGNCTLCIPHNARCP